MSTGDNTPEKRHPLLMTVLGAVAAGLFVLSIVVNFVLVISLAVSAGGDSAVVRGYRKIPSQRNLVEPRRNADQIALVDLKGVITQGSPQQSGFGAVEDPLTAVRNRLNLIRLDDNVKGVLLLVDSPGGSVTPSDSLAWELRRFREETGKPVVSLIENVGASGAYYAASATDAIVAKPTAIVGSIGVIVYNYNVSALLDRFDIRYLPIKSAPEKDFLSPFKPVVEDEIEWMQDLVDSMLARFVDTVDEGRENLSREQVRELADGRVHLGQDAVELGLVDRAGYLEDAVALLSERAELDEPLLVEYQKPPNLRSFLGGASSVLARAADAETPLGLPRPTGPHFYYLWENALRGNAFRTE